MNQLLVVSAAMGLVLGSGLLALAMARLPRLATGLASSGAMAGCALGLWASISALQSDWSGGFAAGWPIPGGALVLGLDPLGAFFLAPIFGLGALCALHGRSYLGDRALPAALFNLLVASMAAVILARHALSFLVAWEAMTVLAYLLVTLDHHDSEARRAGWVYLIASHVAGIALLAFFLGLGARSGGALDFLSLASSGADQGASFALLALALVGFGVKAGVVGLHVWLPEAHAAAPSHVSALMSGALVKVGVYGLLRAALLVGTGAGFGSTLMILGIAGALLGITLALLQRDLKRVLAYSTVENVGVILIALGLGTWARAHGERQVAALAFSGGLLHVWNHAAMKGLLFLGAGNILHATRTRDMERLGGLLRLMPWTGRAMVVGAVAIAALPPLNGFSGEWLLYGALAKVGATGVAASGLPAMAGAAVLALIGGLAGLCFVRLLGVVLLGVPRTGQAALAHDPSWTMTLPLGILAAACVAGALVAPALVRVQSGLMMQLDCSGAEVEVVSRHLGSLVLVDSAALVTLALGIAWLLHRGRRAVRSETWGCGYADPNPRMQYTARGFSEILARVLPPWTRPVLAQDEPEGLFPAAARFSSALDDPLTRTVYEPLMLACATRFTRLRFLQQGNVHIYILYILTTAVVGLVWVAIRDGLAS